MRYIIKYIYKKYTYMLCLNKLLYHILLSIPEDFKVNTAVRT